jgi:hypothetical protein
MPVTIMPLIDITKAVSEPSREDEHRLKVPGVVGPITSVRYRYSCSAQAGRCYNPEKAVAQGDLERMRDPPVCR